MLAEHTNKEKMPCKPPSRYHLKGFAIIIIRVTAALLIMRGKTRKRQSTSRTSMCWQKHSLSIIAVHISPKPICTPMFIHEHHLGQQRTQHTPALCVTHQNRVKNLPAATPALPPRAARRARACPPSCWPPAAGQVRHVMAPGVALGYVLQKGIPEFCTDSKGIQGQLLDRFTFLETPEAFPVLLPRMSLCRDPRQG